MGEIISSMTALKSIIIIDNAHFAKWQHGEYIVKYSKIYKYKVLILEIQCQSLSISIYDHIQHLNANQNISECLLCKMQNHRCKMKINAKIYTKFIKQYEEDSNAIILKAKMNKNEKWTNDQIKKILSMHKEIDYQQYDDDDDYNKWHLQKKRKFHSVNNLDLTLDEMAEKQSDNYRHRKRRKYNNHNRRNHR